MAFDFVEIEDAELRDALEEAGLPVDQDHLESSVAQLLEVPVAKYSHNVKFTGLPSQSERHAAISSKFGTVKLIELDLGNDPVIDTPPTGSPEFAAFVTDIAVKNDDLRNSIVHFTSVIRDAEKLLRHKPVRQDSIFSKMVAVFLSNKVREVPQVFITRKKNNVEVVAKFGKRQSVSTYYVIGGASIHMAVHMNGKITTESVRIYDGRSSAQRVAAAFEPDAKTGVAALHALRIATRSSESDAGGGEFAY